MAMMGAARNRVLLHACKRSYVEGIFNYSRLFTSMRLNWMNDYDIMYSLINKNLTKKGENMKKALSLLFCWTFLFACSFGLSGCIFNRENPYPYRGEYKELYTVAVYSIPNAVGYMYHGEGAYSSDIYVGISRESILYPDLTSLFLTLLIQTVFIKVHNLT